MIDSAQPSLATPSSSASTGAGHPVRTKLRRLARSGVKPRVVDLFCGAGGFSLGFERAGCEIIGGIELDPDAIASHARNFHGELEELDPVLYARHKTPRDIRETDPFEWLRSLGHSTPTDVVDILIGGPPCPAYTRVGRAKLREIHDHPEAFKHDDRAVLYLPYLNWVERLQPVALVMENVPDILNFAGHNLAEEFCEVLAGLGYSCRYSILNAASYGVPQTRPRFILVGVHRAAPASFEFPAPTHEVELPTGYQLAEKAALKPLNDAGSLAESHFTPAPEAAAGAPQAVTAAQALAGLPPLFNHLTEVGRRSSTRPDESTADSYPEGAAGAPGSWVAAHMLGWPGRTLAPDSDPLLGHIIRALTWRDFRLFREMKPGDQYFEAYRLALKMFDACLLDVHQAGGSLLEGTTEAAESVAGIKGVVDSSSRLLRRPSLTAGDVQEIKAMWSELEQLVKAVDDRLEPLVKALDARGLELADAAAVLGWPLSQAWERVAGLLDVLDRPPSSSRLRAFAKECGKAWNGARSWESRDKAWRAGLESLDSTEHHPRGRRCPVRIPSEIRQGKELAECLLADAERLDQLAGARPLFWPADVSPRALLELATLLMVGLAQDHFSFQAIKRQFVPPYLPDKFPNKWRKMEADAPARTLMAHLGKDSYSHIHHDGAQARPVSIREAARLQSFPDSFRFEGSMNPAFRQIGNAVPPLFSWRIAEQVLATVRPERTSGALNGEKAE